MNKRRTWNKRKFTDIVAIAVGFLLIAGAVGIIFDRMDFSKKQSADDVVSAMDALIPNRSRAIPEPHYGRYMPSVEIGGENFVGLLEIEAYSRVLPVAWEWLSSNGDRFPMAYSGSVYDRDLIIGGSSRKGQFDFADEIEIGAGVKFTDLYGREFRYEVIMVNHADSIDRIMSGDDDLTLFAKSKKTSKYVIIRCRLTKM